MVRPIKDIHRIHQPLSCYESDLKFFKEHKGKLSLSAFFIEAGYAYMKNDETRQRDEKRIIEIQELKKTVADLQDKLNFEKLKNKKHAPTSQINEEKLRAFYSIKVLPDLLKGSPPIIWETKFDRNIPELLSDGINNSRELKVWCENEFKKNGAKA